MDFMVDAQVRALLAEREALDEWAWRLAAAKREAALRFDDETRSLLLEREALNAKARNLLQREAMRREVLDSRARQALRIRLLRPHVDDEQALHPWNVVGASKQKVKKRKASYLEPASGKKNLPNKVVFGDQPAKKKKKLSQGEKKTPLSEVSKWCAVCKLDCQNAKALASHLSGKKHKKMLEKSSEEPVSDRRNLLEMDSLVPTSDMTEPSEDEKASIMKVPESWCVVCQLDCNNSKSLVAHQAGRKHLKKLLTLSKEETERLHTALEIHASVEEGRRENDDESSICPTL